MNPVSVVAGVEQRQPGQEGDTMAGKAVEVVLGALDGMRFAEDVVLKDGNLIRADDAVVREAVGDGVGLA